MDAVNVAGGGRRETVLSGASADRLTFNGSDREADEFPFT